MLTLAQIKSTITLNLLSDTDFFDPAGFNQAVNMCVRELSEATLQYEVTNIQTTVVGQYQYALPADCIVVKEVLYDNARLNPESIDAIAALYAPEIPPETTMGFPTMYSKYSLNQIWMYATPNDAKDLKIIYAAYVPDLVNDTDTTPFPARADQYIINRITAQKHLLDGNMETYYAYKKVYEEDMDHVKRATRPVPSVASTDRSFEFPTQSMWRA
jgi:hypothetical protein